MAILIGSAPKPDHPQSAKFGQNKREFPIQAIIAAQALEPSKKCPARASKPAT